MATSATRSITIGFSGDRSGRQEFDAPVSAASPATDVLHTFPIGFSTLTPPTGGSTPKALTIILPSANTATLTLKGITGDTGIVLSPTQHTSLGLNSPTAPIGFTASAEIAGVRLIWT